MSLCGRLIFRFAANRDAAREECRWWDVHAFAGEGTSPGGHDCVCSAQEGVAVVCPGRKEEEQRRKGEAWQPVSESGHSSPECSGSML